MNRFKYIANVLACPEGLFIHLAILLTFSAFLIYKPIKEFKTYDSSPTLTATNKVFQEQPGSKNAPTVEVGFSLDSFSQFNMDNNEFSALGVIWFIYDPNEISETQLQQFSFSKGELQEKSDAITYDYDATKKISRYTVRLKFNTPMDYRNFPIDDHRLFIILKNNLLSSNDVQFITSKNNMVIEPDHLYKTSWSLVNYDAQAGYNQVTLKNDTETENLYFPTIIFSYDYARGGIHTIVLILIPLIFIFFVSLSIFLLQPGEGGSAYRYILFSLLTFLFVLESFSPQVGYLKLSDYAYFAVLFCSFFVITLAWMSNKMSQSLRGCIGTSVEFFLLILLYLVFNVFN